MSKDLDLPKGWLEVEFGELFTLPGDDVVDGPFGSNLKANEYVSAGIPIARLQNIGRNRFVDKNIQFVTFEKAEELEQVMKDVRIRSVQRRSVSQRAGSGA